MKLVKASSVVFHRSFKILKTTNITSEQIILQLSKKLCRDTDYIGPIRYDIEEEISKLSKGISVSDKEINNAIRYLNSRQNSLTKFLVNYNNELDRKETELLSQENKESNGN